MKIVCVLLTIIVPESIMGFTCPDVISQVCSCYTTSAPGNVRIETFHHIDCSSRHLKKLPVFHLKSGIKLYELNLKNNSVTSLSDSNFPAKLSVSVLDISMNPIGTVERNFVERSFTGLKVLKASEIGLDLQNESCLLFLNHLHSLEELDLSRNMEYGIDKLPSVFVENELHSLKKLSLSLCRIKDVNPHAFMGLNNLREMDLSRNYLSRVPRALNRLAVLRKLNLRENDITVVYHGDFSGLNCLEEVDLSRNLLGQLQAFRYGALFGLENSLVKLIIHDSHLASIPTKTLAELKKLKHLDISNNSIMFMTNESFDGDYQLLTLDISGNPWLIEDDMFDSVKDSLITLRMRSIGLTFLPRTALQRLKKLRNLDVSHNNLMFINNETIKGISARRLSFMGNRIRYISPDAFGHFRRPVDVDVSMNVLDTLNFVFDSEMCTFYRVNISHNGFLCDCQIEKILNSRRVHSLEGNCVLKTGQLVSFSNRSMIRDLEKSCGKTEDTFCYWWMPKSNTSKNNPQKLCLWSFTVYILYFIYLVNV